MALLLNAYRALVVGAVVFTYGLLYGLRRVPLVFIRDTYRRRSAVARLQGQVLRGGMASLGACFVKLGQVMSSRPDLFEPELIEELRLLQDRLPPFAFAHVERTIERTLGGKVADHFETVEREAVAAASVAQVHRAVLRDGREAAIKVLRPNVRDAVERDRSLLLAFARLLNLSPTLRLSDPVGHVRMFVDAIVDQTDLRLEAANYTRFRENFKHEPRVTFPEVYPEFSGECLLTMSFVRGRKLDSLGEGDWSALATALREAAFQMCLTDGFVHADMHPGNMMMREDGVLVLFDVGLATKLDDNVRVQFVDMVKCLSMGTADDILAHFKRYHTYVDSVLWEDLREQLLQFAAKWRKIDVATVDYGELINELLAIGRRYKVRPVTDLAMVIVATVTCQGIGKVLCPDVNDFQEMAKFVLPLLAQAGEAVPDSDEARAAMAALQTS